MIDKDFLDFVCRDSFLRNFIPSIDVIRFIACQFALESDFGRSELAKIHSNYCGMKYPHRRFSFASSNVGEFATYGSFHLCVKDYLMWIFFNRPYYSNLSNLNSFKYFLRDSGYCPEKDYISKIETLYSKYYG